MLVSLQKHFDECNVKDKLENISGIAMFSKNN